MSYNTSATNRPAVDGRGQQPAMDPYGRRPSADGHGPAPSGQGRDEDFAFWRDHTRIFLQPVAAPSVLGLFGFAGATFMAAAYLAGWFGTLGRTPTFVFPFAAMLGGLAQFSAGMWGFRARDTLATAMHGVWGAFWLGYGILYLLVAVHVLTPPHRFTALGFWFVVLAGITASGAIAALGVNLSLALTLITLAAGAACEAVANILPSTGWRITGGWFFIASAILGWYTATALLFEATFKRVVLPMGRVGGHNRPGAMPSKPIQYFAGEPGVKVGQ